MSGYVSIPHTTGEVNGRGNHSCKFLFRRFFTLLVTGKTTRRLNGENEPLARFNEAKKALGETFSELREHVIELHSLYERMLLFQQLTSFSSLGMNEPQNGEAASTKESSQEILTIRDSIDTIMDTFRRDNMKVVFFGRCSYSVDLLIFL